MAIYSATNDYKAKRKKIGHVWWLREQKIYIYVYANNNNNNEAAYTKPAIYEREWEKKRE